MRLALTLVTIFVVVAVVAVWLPTKVLRRRQVKTPGSSGLVVRCAKGHLFTTIWIPGASFKSVRLGVKRYQHCPVGHHWSAVTPVNATELSEAERTEAARAHDIRIP
jgi:hypothetical protein